MTYGDPYIHNHTHSLNTGVVGGSLSGYPVYSDRPWTELLTELNTIKHKEKTMSTAQKVAAERAEARERERIEVAYAAYDALELDTWPQPCVVLFTVDYERDHDYTYAALHINDRWYLTGSVCHGVKTEDFLAWLIERRVPAEGLDLLGQVET